MLDEPVIEWTVPPPPTGEDHLNRLTHSGRAFLEQGVTDSEWCPKDESEYQRLVMEQQEVLSIMFAKQARERLRLALRLRREHATA